MKTRNKLDTRFRLQYSIWFEKYLNIYTLGLTNCPLINLLHLITRYKPYEISPLNSLYNCVTV
jgi:hypothetical protein